VTDLGRLSRTRIAAASYDAQVIVEPVPLGPPSARRRRLRALALVVPLLLLGGVVAAGTLGPQATPPPSPPVPAAVASSITPSAPPSSPGTTAPVALQTGRPPDLPARIAGLDVLTVGEAIESRRAGDLVGVTAVAGYLGVRDATPCSGTFCARTAMLATSPFTATTSFADIGRHLHPQFPAGVVMPRAAILSDPDPSADRPQAPLVIVVARFDDPRARACVRAGRHCGEELVVERVVWVEDDSYPANRAVGPAVPLITPAIRVRTAGRTAERGLGATATPMMTVLVRPGTIADIDPSMAEFLPDVGPDPVWYVRGLRLGLDPTIVWVIARADGSLLMRGEQPVLPRPATPSAPPG
jgi:hypothetical protein